MLIAWCGHSAESRELAESLRAAIVEVHGSEKAGALAMGLTPQKLSRQLAGAEPFNLFRACAPALLVAVMRIHAGKMGHSLLTAQDKDFILGCVGLGKKKLARFLVPDVHDERQVG